jgi:hypothetical protein
LHSSSDIIRRIKSRRKRWTGHLARKRGRAIFVKYVREARRKEATRKPSI